VTAAYRSGGRYEAKTADLFTAEGYACWLARGSKGAADVLAVKRGQIILIQVKSSRLGQAFDHKGWNALYRLAADLGVVPVWCHWTPYHRTPSLHRVTGLHARGSRHWPCEPFAVDELAALLALPGRATFNTRRAAP
jgi:hypothetical protein